MTTDTFPNDSETVQRAAKIIAESLAQGLMEAEVILGAERETRSQTVPPQVVEALERFGTILGKLLEFNEQLGERVAELTDAVARLAEAQAAAPAPSPSLGGGLSAKPQLPDMEPSYAPGGEGIDVTIAAVPGFQGLMELQRALVRLPQVHSAAVRRYQDDEASIQLVLSQPMSANTIAEGVTASTGRGIVVDESRPDALRLRLRFIGGE